jgi:chaperone required for assembly of F1-ATPase
MKRFWQDVTVAPADRGWRVALDGKPIRTQGGAPQVVPVEALARALASEWEAQGETVDPKAFVLRDLADFAIDQVVPDAAAAVARLLPYAETDTLCYRADPDEPLYRRQLAEWEPIVAACEARHGLRLERVSGIVARPLPGDTRARLAEVLAALDPFQLAALETMTSIACSTPCVAAYECARHCPESGPARRSRQQECVDTSHGSQARSPQPASHRPLRHELPGGAGATSRTASRSANR